MYAENLYFMIFNVTYNSFLILNEIVTLNVCISNINESYIIIYAMLYNWYIEPVCLLWKNNKLLNKTPNLERI